MIKLLDSCVEMEFFMNPIVVQLTYAKEKVKIKRWYVLLFKNMCWGSVNSKIARDKSTC